MKGLSPYIVLISLLGFFGCDTDFEVNADWEEIGIAYMILDHHDDVQYLKLNRAFLNTEKNANEVAQIQDSLYFNDEDMKVTLTAGINNNKRTVELIRVLVEDKDSGVFAGPDQYLYRTPEGFQVDFARIHVLEIENTKTGYKMSSEARIARDGTINWPFTGTESVGFTLCDSENNLRGYVNKTMEIVSGRDVKFYDFDVVFHYQEVDRNNPTDTVDKELNWTIARSLRATSVRGGTPIRSKINGESFFDFLALRLEAPREGVVRIAGNLDFEFRGGGLELYDFINVNTPSIGIVQKVPEYTNIENGLGIFSSRSLQVESLPLDRCSEFQLVNGDKTRNLGFVR